MHRRKGSSIIIIFFFFLPQLPVFYSPKMTASLFITSALVWLADGCKDGEWRWGRVGNHGDTCTRVRPCTCVVLRQDGKGRWDVAGSYLKASLSCPLNQRWRCPNGASRTRLPAPSPPPSLPRRRLMASRGLRRSDDTAITIGNPPSPLSSPLPRRRPPRRAQASFPVQRRRDAMIKAADEPLTAGKTEGERRG